jgi:transposase-like protein
MKTTLKLQDGVMLDEFDADDLNLISLAQEYADDDKARELLERLRWPNGPVCPHCKNDGKAKTISKLTPKKPGKTAVRKGVYFCGACRKQFTVTVNTVFEGSHIPIGKWMMAWFLICSSKKGMSAHQMHRMLKVTYKTAWFLCHRIRFALGDDGKGKLAGTVEVDETFVGGKGDIKTKFSRQVPVVALVERGGRAKTSVVASVSQNNLGKVLAECVDTSAIINTDEHRGYNPAGKKFAGHDSVNHSKEEYHRVNPDGTVTTTNSAESFFSLLKRGVYGQWHHVSREHLPKYAGEFAFRWSTNKITDGARLAQGIPLSDGKRLYYRQPGN